MNVVLWMGAGALIFVLGMMASGGINTELLHRYKKSLDKIDWYREERADFIDLANDLVSEAGVPTQVEGYPRLDIEVRTEDWVRLEEIASIRLPRVD